MPDQVIISEESFIKKGRMKKSPLLMSDGEKKAWELQMSLGIRDYLFSIGQPLVYKKEGKMIAEYSDGQIKNL